MKNCQNMTYIAIGCFFFISWKLLMGIDWNFAFLPRRLKISKWKWSQAWTVLKNLGGWGNFEKLTKYDFLPFFYILYISWNLFMEIDWNFAFIPSRLIKEVIQEFLMFWKLFIKIECNFALYQGY